MINKVLILVALSSIVAISGCKKDNEETPITTDQTQLEKNILSDFADHVINPNYAEINSKADILKQDAINLSLNQTDVNLNKVRDSWRDVREAWEESEGYLFGPVEDFNYDPEMDTWPLNVVDMQALLAGTNPLTASDIDSLPTSVKGFHAIEYVIFGVGGVKTAIQITSREMSYLISLTENLHRVTSNLRESWLAGGFTTEWKNAGAGSTRFTSRVDAYVSLVTAMAGICEEVSEGKMNDPFVAQDSTLEESQFSHNSTADFTNNMEGVKNAYMGKYNSDGQGLNELVSLRNSSMDLRIQSQLNLVISGFNNINSNYGQAIYNQAAQIQQQQLAINDLKTILEDELIPALQLWITE